MKLDNLNQAQREKLAVDLVNWLQAYVPSPTGPTESPNLTQGTTVIDAELGVWEIGEGKELLRDGLDTTGRGSQYMYVDHQVYTLGTDNRWWHYAGPMQWVFFSVNSPIPLPVAPVQNTKTCINLTATGASGGVDPFINRFKRSSRWWNSGGNTPAWYQAQKDNWVRGIPAGEGISNLVTVNDIGGELDFSEQRSGMHLILWKDALSLSHTGSNTEAGKELSKGRYQFNVPATIEVDSVRLANPALNLVVMNNTQGMLDHVSVIENNVQYPALIHADDEKDFLAGKHYQRSFINALSGASYVRTMDWNGCVRQGQDAYGKVSVESILPEHYMLPTDRTYVWPDDNSLFFPPSEIGHLAIEANVGIFNTMASKTSDAAFHYWGKEYAAVVGPDWNKELLSELGDENWNVGWPWVIGRIHLRDVVAPTIKVVDLQGNPSTSETDAMGCASASRAISMWNIMEKYVPREVHKRVLGGQFAWPEGGMGGQFSYVDPATGKKAHELADYYAVAPYWWSDIGDVTLDQLLNEKMWLLGDKFWIDGCTKAIDSHQKTLATNKEILARYAPNLLLTCYEGGGWLHNYALPRQGQPNYALAKEFDGYCRYFMDNEPGKVVMQYYWDKLIKGNFALYNQFNHQQYSLGKQEGLINSQHRPDTPRQALFRTLGK